MNPGILSFEDINEAHQAMGFVGRTDIPEFHIFSVEETYPSSREWMPPYRFSFYCIAFLQNSKDAELHSNDQRPEVDGLLAFQSPAHVVSWARGAEQRGFIVYFRGEFLSADLPAAAYPFFNPANRNLLYPDRRQWEALAARFSLLHSAFHDRVPNRRARLRADLGALLEHCRTVFLDHGGELIAAPAGALASRFYQLVESRYLSRQSVAAYAAQLGVSVSHLSAEVRRAYQKTCKQMLTERIVVEGKKLLRHSTLSVAEIGDSLGFSEPTHFVRLFKGATGRTPGEYRLSGPEDS